MRILFSFIGGDGHFRPLLPLARHAVAAGHTVAFAAGPGMVPTVEAEGFAAFATGPGSGRVPERLPLLPLDPEREDRDLRERFARQAARERAAAALPLYAGWRPDLLVCDEIDFGAMVAAERLGLAHATVLVIAAGSFVRPAVVAGALDEVRGEHGLPPDPELAMLSRYLVLSPFPPSLRDPAFPPPPTAHWFRPPALDPAAGGPAPPWSTTLPGAPVVYFTLGTVFNTESGDLFARVLGGLRELPVNLLVTVGRHLDPAEFGPQPANVHIRRYVPHASVLPHCDLVVSHGGSGTVVEALAHGLPSVQLPMGADQPLNAERCARLGVARVLDALTVTPERARAAVSAVLADPSYRRAAERVRDEIAALPGVGEAVALLERLGSDRRPVLRWKP